MIDEQAACKRIAVEGVRREDDGSYGVIEDVGTMNGTFVNGERLVAGRPLAVANGDSVVFGTIQCRFEINGD